MDDQSLAEALQVARGQRTLGPPAREEPGPGPFDVPIGPQDFVTVPTAIAVFDNHFVSEGILPREWAERLYNVVRWTVMPSGGHFAAAEEPERLARDIAGFFAEL